MAGAQVLRWSRTGMRPQKSSGVIGPLLRPWSPSAWSTLFKFYLSFKRRENLKRLLKFVWINVLMMNKGSGKAIMIDLLRTIWHSNSDLFYHRDRFMGAAALYGASFASVV